MRNIRHEQIFPSVPGIKPLWNEAAARKLGSGWLSKKQTCVNTCSVADDGGILQNGRPKALALVRIAPRLTIMRGPACN